MHSVIKIAECSGFDDLIYSAERNARTQEQREFVRKLLKKYHFWGDKMLIKFCDYKTLQSIVEP